MSGPSARTEFSELHTSILANWLLRERLNAFNALGIALLISGGVAFYLWTLSSNGVELGLFWLAAAWFATVLLFLLLKADSRKKVSTLALLAALLSLGWSSGMLYMTAANTETWIACLGLLLLLNLSLAWNVWQQVLLVSLHLLVVLALGAQLSQFLGLAVLGIVAIVALRNSGLTKLHFLSDISIVDYLRLCEAVKSDSLIRTLGMELSLLARTVVIYGNETAEIFDDGALSTASTEPIFYRGLWHRAMEQEFHDTVFTRAELGADFVPALLSWFGNVPERIMVFRAIHLKQEREESILIVVPVAHWFSLIGFRRVFLDLCYVVSLFRTGLQIMRTRALSSGFLSATQHSISEQESEVHELIHHVNNMAQDISIICSNSQEALAGSEVPSKPVLQDAFKRIEIGARALSYEVSDLKIERELDKGLTNFSLEQRDFSSLMEDFSVYSSHRAFRKGMQVTILDRTATGKEGEVHLVKVCSREYFGTALRGFLRYIESQLPKQGEIQVEATLEDRFIKIRFSDTGPTRTLDLENGPLPAPVQRLKDLVKASAGQVGQENADSRFNNIFTIALGFSSGENGVRRSGIQWALFVDDDPEISVFYERVAGALNLEAHTATNCNQARKILEELGKPRIVISDLELQDGSGVDIIRFARELFGLDLPVIIVSGHSEGKHFEEAKSAGCDRFLVKPVGRKKLFAEIQEVLAR